MIIISTTRKSNKNNTTRKSNNNDNTTNDTTNHNMFIGGEVDEAPLPAPSGPAAQAYTTTATTVDLRNFIVLFWAETLAH